MGGLGKHWKGGRAQRLGNKDLDTVRIKYPSLSLGVKKKKSCAQKMEWYAILSPL